MNKNSSTKILLFFAFHVKLTAEDEAAQHSHAYNYWKSNQSICFFLFGNTVNAEKKQNLSQKGICNVL